MGHIAYIDPVQDFIFKFMTILFAALQYFFHQIAFGKKHKAYFLFAHQVNSVGNHNLVSFKKDNVNQWTDLGNLTFHHLASLLMFLLCGPKSPHSLHNFSELQAAHCSHRQFKFRGI